MKNKVLTIGYTTYRPEMAPLAHAQMEDYDCVLLEEPKTPGFEEMLKKELSIDEYLMMTDFEFPEFAKRSCTNHRELFEKGTHIVQEDPFMDELVSIHEFFVAGGSPGDLQEGTKNWEVYQSERKWTKALLRFYTASKQASFQEVVHSVKAFARADAAKGRLRDQMRATHIKKYLDTYTKIYVEAGYIHTALLPYLLPLRKEGVRVQPLYLMEEIVKPLSGKRQVLAPGDTLTMIYTCHPHFEGKKTDLLAARSLVYNKLILKEEQLDTTQQYPHIQDELECVSLVESLNFEQCQQLFLEVKAMPTHRAREHVRLEYH